MSKFYIRVFQNGIPYRTVGTTCRMLNDKNVKDMIRRDIDQVEKAYYEYNNSLVSSTIYHYELISNRRGEKRMYRRVTLTFKVDNDKRITNRIITKYFDNYGTKDNPIWTVSEIEINGIRFSRNRKS